MPNRVMFNVYAIHLPNTLMFRLLLAALLTAFILTGCVTTRETQPTQTAREQLLLSTASDQVSHKIHPGLAPGTRIFVDASNFDAGSEYLGQYGLAAIKTQLLEDGFNLVSSADTADVIANVSSGALSINNTQQLFGLPATDVPVPFSGAVKTPEVALWKKHERTGIAKVAVAFYNAKTGHLMSATGPLYGRSHYDQMSLLFYHWKHSNLMPKEPKKSKTSQKSQK